METLEAIRTRRSHTDLSDEVPDREAVERILDVARWAPTHYHTEPWRFLVFAGEGREKLADIWEAHAREQAEERGTEITDEFINGMRAKAFRSPVLIVVVCDPDPEPPVVETEEISATAAAVQNILLAAHASGLAAKWRTGDVAYTDAAREILRLKEGERIIAYVYLGCPKGEIPQDEERASLDEKAEWFGWDD